MTLTNTATAKQRFDEDGFFLVDHPAIPADVIADAVAGQDAIMRGEYDTGRPPCESPWNPGDDPNRLVKIENPQYANKAIHRLVSHPALGKWAAEITGAKMVQAWWVQMLVKPPAKPGVPSHVGWHQDLNYWKAWVPGSEVFTAWVALSDVTADAGPMRFVRGSHKWGLVEGSDFYAKDPKKQLETLKAKYSPWEEVAAILPPGGFSFHDDLTYHGSDENKSKGLRRSFAIHLRTEKSTGASGSHSFTKELDKQELRPVLFGSR